MSDKEDSSIVPRASGELVRIPPGASAIIGGMVSDAMEIIHARDTGQQKKTDSQSNTRSDPEVMTLGTKIAAFHIEAGARNFSSYVKKVMEDMGECVEFIRPYLKSWYNAARDYPGLEQYRDEMTPYDEVVRLADTDIDAMLSDGDADESRQVPPSKPMRRGRADE